MGISKMGQRVNDHASLKTLKIPPAIEAGITDHIWTLEEIISLLK